MGQWKIQAIVESVSISLGWIVLFGFFEQWISLIDLLAIQSSVDTFSVIWWLSWSYRQLMIETKVV